jgi:signal transduction histidine kinase
MNEKPLRVLIIEDNPADAELLELELLRGGYLPDLCRVQSAAEMQAALDEREWDLVLSDFTLPGFTGFHALEVLKASGQDIPFILISGSAGDDVAVTAMRAGAHDFFTKGSLALLVSAIQRELREAELRAVSRAQREQLHRNEKLAALGTLMAGVAHELNNPLSVIMHQATLLQTALGSDPRQARAARILYAVNACSQIVRNFLALARHEPPRQVPVSINEVINAAIDLLAYGLRTDDIELELDLAAELPAVEGDPQQLERVIINLVTNAQYALRSRPLPRRIVIRSHLDSSGAQLLLQVSDNGEGIPPEIRSRIFDPFFTTKPAGEGTGLGLSLCHGIITAHQGEIAMSDEVETGTTVVIKLPVASNARVACAASDDTESSSPPSRILVVDDNAEVAAGFREILVAQGHHVDTELTSRAALPRILTGAYALVMADIRMPDLDGPALYREVMARSPELAKTFLFITGDTFSRDRDAFLKETQAVYLAKPCTYEEVEDAVAKALQRSSSSETSW